MLRYRSRHPIWVYSKHKWECLVLKNVTSPFVPGPASRSFSNFPASARFHTKLAILLSCPPRPQAPSLLHQLIVQSILVYYDSAWLLQNLILLLFFFSLHFSLLLGAVFILLSFNSIFILFLIFNFSLFLFHFIFDFQ